MIEDDPNDRSVPRELLRKRSFSVFEATHGREALDRMATDGNEGIQLTRRETPDLIIVDLSLPILDGWAASRELKDAADTRHIPIIALSAHAMAGDREKALAAGCDDYDTKPVEFKRLVEKINALLAGGDTGS